VGEGGREMIHIPIEFSRQNKVGEVTHIFQWMNRFAESNTKLEVGESRREEVHNMVESIAKNEVGDVVGYVVGYVVG
jgi:hypothetical protein